MKSCNFSITPGVSDDWFAKTLDTGNGLCFNDEA